MLNKRAPAVWLQNDYAILRESGHRLDWISSDSVVGYFKQWRKAKGYDLYLSWGGRSLHTVLFAKLFNGKSIIVAVGGDAAEVPEIPYGAFATWKKHFVKFVFETADVVLTVSEFTRREVLQHSKPKNVRVVYHGIDTERYKPEGEKKQMVLLVSALRPRSWTMKVKGLETFVRGAKYLPDVPFVLVGEVGDDVCVRHLKKIASSNVRILGYLPSEELVSYYHRSKVYVQISLRESFGVALAEAMSCECVPVVTENGALPEVVGDTGFYVPYDNPKATAEAIEEALDAPTEVGKKARKRIKDMFPLQKRKEKLLEIINAMMK
jgi:glycosyltransferase involved in cell wall biosynthesis